MIPYANYCLHDHFFILSAVTSKNRKSIYFCDALYVTHTYRNTPILKLAIIQNENLEHRYFSMEKLILLHFCCWCDYAIVYLFFFPFASCFLYLA